MGEQTDGRPEERGQRFTDRGERFRRRGFLKKTGIGAVAIGTGALLAGCQFDHGAYQGYSTGQSSTSGQHATPSPSSTGQGSSGSQSGQSS
jgi:hypothetical protein